MVPPRWTAVLTSILQDWQPGDVRAIGCADVAALTATLDLSPRDPEDQALRYVTCRWDRVPDLDALLDGSVRGLARAALAVWPLWYTANLERVSAQPTAAAADSTRARIDAAPNVIEGVVGAWLAPAASLCAAGSLPLPEGFSRTEQAQQLGLALGATARLAIVLAANEVAPAAGRLLGLARTAEWLAQWTGARLALVLHGPLLRSPEIDSVAYSSVELVSHSDEGASDARMRATEDSELAPRVAAPTELKAERALDTTARESQTHAAGPGANELKAGQHLPSGAQAVCMQAHQGEAWLRTRREDLEQDRSLVSPLIGRPHPLSPGEQLLAAYLEGDADLGPLFGFNLPVLTASGRRYLVDLLWADGSVVVEIDGYQIHSTRAAFSLDRHRDYELVTSGYLVLRLPHDEVQEDVQRATDKIRDVVDFRRRQMRLLPPS